MKYFATVVFSLLLFCSCGGKDQSGTPTPRRYAYPRIADIDTARRTVELGPVTLRVNAAATATVTRPGWLDLSYPQLGAKVYLSATRSDDVAAAMANRRQRIALNLGDAKAMVSEFVAGDYTCTVVESVDAGTTPVQFYAVSPAGVMVSGAATLSGNTVPADSIQPIVSLLAADAVEMLKSIR